MPTFDLPEKAVIGALHFMPLLGYPDFQGFDRVLERAAEDMRAFERGGIDAIILENNYDLPHRIKVGPETVAAMTLLGKELKKLTKLPLGISVLWNDYEASFAIAKAIGGKFIRVPVFVDSVITDFGAIAAEPEMVTAYREKIHADEVAIMADVQVKHAKMQKPRSISLSAEDAEAHGADAIIITGTKTGEPPSLRDLKDAKGASGAKIVVGSGLDKSNALQLLEYSDYAIVSTSLKKGASIESERNVKHYSSPIDSAKVKELMDIVKAARG